MGLDVCEVSVGEQIAVVFLAVAEHWWPWPKFKAFMRGLPTVIRFFIVGALVLMVFIDIRASGFTPSGILAILLALSIALYLWETRTGRMSSDSNLKAHP